MGGNWATIARVALTIVGTVLVTHGYIKQDDWTKFSVSTIEYAGVAGPIIGAIWGVLQNRWNTRKLVAAANLQHHETVTLATLPAVAPQINAAAKQVK